MITALLDKDGFIVETRKGNKWSPSEQTMPIVEVPTDTPLGILPFLRIIDGLVVNHSTKKYINGTLVEANPRLAGCVALYSGWTPAMKPDYTILLVTEDRKSTKSVVRINIKGMKITIIWDAIINQLHSSGHNILYVQDITHTRLTLYMERHGIYVELAK